MNFSHVIQMATKRYLKARLNIKIKSSHYVSYFFKINLDHSRGRQGQKNFLSLLSVTLGDPHPLRCTLRFFIIYFQLKKVY